MSKNLLNNPTIHSFHEKETGLTFIINDNTNERVCQMTPPYSLQDADNIVSALNSTRCFENPSEDIPKVIEALKYAKTLQDKKHKKYYMGYLQKNIIDEALALYKEDK